MFFFFSSACRVRTRDLLNITIPCTWFGITTYWSICAFGYGRFMNRPYKGFYDYDAMNVIWHHNVLVKLYVRKMIRYFSPTSIHNLSGLGQHRTILLDFTQNTLSIFRPHHDVIQPLTRVVVFFQSYAPSLMYLRILSHTFDRWIRFPLIPFLPTRDVIHHVSTNAIRRSRFFLPGCFLVMLFCVGLRNHWRSVMALQDHSPSLAIFSPLCISIHIFQIPIAPLECVLISAPFLAHFFLCKKK
jgi:hypothetical protein